MCCGPTLRFGLFILLTFSCGQRGYAGGRLLRLGGKVWRVNPQGKIEPFRYTFATTGDRGVADFGTTFPLPSPDGRWIVFGRDTNLHVLNVDTGRQRQLTKYGRPYAWPYTSVEVLISAWSPDSRRILFAVVSGETDCPAEDCEHDRLVRPAPYGFYTYDLKTGKTLHIPVPKGFRFSAWLPDGRFLGRVTTVNMKPCEERLAIFSPGKRQGIAVGASIGSPGQIDVSSDGRWAVGYFGVGCGEPEKAQLVKIDLQRRSATLVMPPAPWAENQQPYFSPAADHVAYVHQDPVDQGVPDTYLMIDGERLTSCHGYINYEWADERSIGVSCQDEVFIVDIATRPTGHAAQVELFEHRTSRIVEHFSTSGRTLVASVVDLAYSYQLPMAVEYADSDAATRPLHLQFNNKSVRAILEDIVRQAPQYRVSFSNSIVDIYAPRAREDTSNLLNQVIKDFSVSEMETRRAEFQLFCDLSMVTGSSACTGSLAGGQWEPQRITLHLQNAKVYEVLNAIVAQNGKAIWTITASPRKLSMQTGGFWYIYPLQRPFQEGVVERLARVR